MHVIGIGEETVEVNASKDQINRSRKAVFVNARLGGLSCLLD